MIIIILDCINSFTSVRYDIYWNLDMSKQCFNIPLVERFIFCYKNFFKGSEGFLGTATLSLENSLLLESFLDRSFSHIAIPFPNN